MSGTDSIINSASQSRQAARQRLEILYCFNKERLMMGKSANDRCNGVDGTGRLFIAVGIVSFITYSIEGLRTLYENCVIPNISKVSILQS